VTTLSQFATIWTSPRVTIREILDTDPGKLFLPLAATYGVVYSFHRVLKHEVDLSTEVPVFGVLLANVVFGAIFGIGIFFFLSYLLAGFGRLFGGKPSSRAARTVLAWASMPYVPLLVVILPLMMVAGDTMIRYSERDICRGAAGAGLQIAGLIYFCARGVMEIWSLVLAVVGLSEAFGISVERSFLLLVLAGAVRIALTVGTLYLLWTNGIL
jgi:hypothetical protein